MNKPRYVCSLTINHYCLDAIDNLRAKRCDFHKSDLTTEEVADHLVDYAKDNKAELRVGYEVYLDNRDGRLYGTYQEPLYYEVCIEGKWV